MAFTPKNLTALEGTTFTLPLCVYNKSLNPDILAIINWGDGSKEKITNFVKENDFYYSKQVNKVYTFPGNYTISVEIKRSAKDIFNDGFMNVGFYNMTVYPTTLSFAPSSNFLVNDLSEDNRSVNIYLDDSGIPHDFTGKTLTSSLLDNQSNSIGSFTLLYSSSVRGKIEVQIDQNTINAMGLNVDYYYSIIEIDNTTQVSSMILQGVIKKISPNSNGITIS